VRLPELRRPQGLARADQGYIIFDLLGFDGKGAVTLSKPESRMVWGFMLAATLSELTAASFMFQPQGSWSATLWRYASDPPGTVLAWVASALVMAGYVARAASRSPVIRTYAFAPGSWHPFLGVRLLAVPMAFVTGFFEEAFFRKAIMDAAERHGLDAVLQVVISALVFGVVHSIWAVFGGKFRAALAIVMATSFLGGLLAVVYLIGGRSIGPCIAAHIGLNLFLEPWMVISSATGSWGKQSLRAPMAESGAQVA
jgi:hypothetical protein